VQLHTETGTFGDQAAKPTMVWRGTSVGGGTPIMVAKPRSAGLTGTRFVVAKGLPGGPVSGPQD
jgi:hypothetical protein